MKTVLTGTDNRHRNRIHNLWGRMEQPAIHSRPVLSLLSSITTLIPPPSSFALLITTDLVLIPTFYM